MDNTTQPNSLDQELVQATLDQAAVDKAKKKIVSGRVGVFLIVGLMALAGLLFNVAEETLVDQGYDTELLPIMMITAFVFAGVFLLLGIWSISQPYPPLLIALILWSLNVVLSLVQLLQTGGNGALGLVIAGLLLGLVIRGWTGARDLQRLKRSPSAA